jgi:hypothetical protein
LAGATLGSLLVSSLSLGEVMAACVIGFAACHVTAKAGCVINGCCAAQLRWGIAGQPLRIRMPLPTIEIIATAAALAIATLLTESAGSFALAYLTLHACLRTASKFLRSRHFGEFEPYQLLREAVAPVYVLTLLCFSS